MRRAPALLALAALAVVPLTGCSSVLNPQLRDLEDVPVVDLENARIYTNVKNYANVVVGCIEGRAFSFTTRDYEAVERQPDLDDAICGSPQ